MPIIPYSREKRASVQFDHGSCRSDQSNGFRLKEKNKKNQDRLVYTGETRLKEEERTDLEAFRMPNMPGLPGSQPALSFPHNLLESESYHHNFEDEDTRYEDVSIMTNVTGRDSLTRKESTRSWEEEKRTRQNVGEDRGAETI
ncbi:uncharacterized protein LOC144303321 [Canis aureus]